MKRLGSVLLSGSLLFWGANSAPAMDISTDTEYCNALDNVAKKGKFMFIVKDKMNLYMVYWDPNAPNMFGIYYGDSADDLREHSASGHYPYFELHQYIVLKTTEITDVSHVVTDIDRDGYYDLTIEVVFKNGGCGKEDYRMDPETDRLIRMERSMVSLEQASP